MQKATTRQQNTGKFILLLIFAICMSECGTHGSIIGYRYPTTKANLQRAIMEVIRENPNIVKDTVNPGTHSSSIDYYNDIENYVTLTIKTGKVENDLIFRYYGDEEIWKSEKGSEIFICYVFDKRSGRWCSDGDGNVDEAMAKEFSAIFEKELVNKVDKLLDMRHIVDE